MKPRRDGIITLFAILFLILFTDAVLAQKSAVMMAGANKPIGTPRGTFPGRVAWIHDTLAAKWDGVNGYWWDDKFTPQLEATRMVDSAVTSLTGKATVADAWNELFRHFNLTKKKVNRGYSPNEKIAIKINENNTYMHGNNKDINASPQMVYALLRSLIFNAYIMQKDITVFDASRFITDNIYNKCHADFPEVNFLDNSGRDGRLKSEYVENAIPYSTDNGQLATGLVKCVVEADYVINFALLKGHIGQGVTLCGKNYYGTTSIDKDWRKNFHNNFEQDRTGKPKYITFVDFLGHKDLGEKTMLFLIDGLYGSKLVDGPPKPKWKMQPFNGGWPCSLFASQDGVAIDAVGVDFISSEWPDALDIDYADAYLVEAALANDPPSKTKYDPERDGIPCISLGVLEHWNNATEKKYNHDFGKPGGIELLYKPINTPTATTEQGR